MQNQFEVVHEIFKSFCLGSVCLVVLKRALLSSGCLKTKLDMLRYLLWRDFFDVYFRFTIFDKPAGLEMAVKKSCCDNKESMHDSLCPLLLDLNNISGARVSTVKHYGKLLFAYVSFMRLGSETLPHTSPKPTGCACIYLHLWM